MKNYKPHILLGGLLTGWTLASIGPEFLEMTKTEIDTSLISRVESIRKERIWAKKDRAREAENARMREEEDKGAAKELTKSRELPESIIVHRLPSLKPIPHFIPRNYERTSTNYQAQL